MFTDTTKKYRELIAYALIAVAGLYFIAGLSLLFKSGPGFGEKAAGFGWIFASPIPVLCLVVAVILVTRLGDLTPNARIVVLAALGVAGVDALFAVITFFGQFGADDGFVGIADFGGVLGAGKIVGLVLGLAHLTFLGAAGFFVFTAFQGLPAPTPAPAAQQWGGAGQSFGQHGPSAGQPPSSQQAWGQQPDSSQGQPAGQGGWAQPGGWTSPAAGQQPGWGQQPTPGGQQGGWPQPAPEPPGAPQPWGQQSGAWEQQPAAGWEQPAQAATPGWGSTPAYQPSGGSASAAPTHEPEVWERPERNDVPANEDWRADPAPTPEPAVDSSEDGATDLFADYSGATQPDAETDHERPDHEQSDHEQSDHEQSEPQQEEPPAAQGWWQHPQQ